jgi:hypothetical protein
MAARSLITDTATSIGHRTQEFRRKTGPCPQPRPSRAVVDKASARDRKGPSFGVRAAVGHQYRGEWAVWGMLLKTGRPLFHFSGSGGITPGSLTKCSLKRGGRSCARSHTGVGQLRSDEEFLEQLLGAPVVRSLHPRSCRANLAREGIIVLIEGASENFYERNVLPAGRGPQHSLFVS